MRTLFLFLFLFSCTPFSIVCAQTPQEQIQQSVNDLKKEIADQEKLIVEAKKNNEDPDTIKSMEKELNQLKQQLAIMEKAVKGVKNIPSSVMNKATDQF